MKELSIKEKAKAYDEAIKKAESLYKAAEPMSGCNVIIETLFPELKESGDEKIRKRLITDFGTIGKKEWGGLEVKDILAWLEKQGKKSADSYCQEHCKGYQETGKCFADGGCAERFDYENANIEQKDFASALKDLPKWKKCDTNKLYPHNGYLYWNNYMIDGRELWEKLEKED